MSKKYAYILGGGGGKIGFAAGVLYALYRKGIRPNIISGISSGNLAGIMAATDQVPKLKELLHRITDDQILKKRGVLNYAVRYGLHKIGIKKPLLGLYDNGPLRNLLETQLLGKHTICDFYTGVVDIEKDRFIHYRIPKHTRITETDIKYVLASTAVPFVFPPVKLNGMTLVDGGVHYNTPFKPMKQVIRNKQVGVTHIIAVSMKEPLEIDKDIKDDVGIAPVLVQGLLSRAAEEDIANYELINKIAEQHGTLTVDGKKYRHYPGRVFRPLRNLAPSGRFHHKYMKPDFVHGYKLSQSYNP